MTPEEQAALSEQLRTSMLANALGCVELVLAVEDLPVPTEADREWIEIGIGAGCMGAVEALREHGFLPESGGE